MFLLFLQIQYLILQQFLEQCQKNLPEAVTLVGAIRHLVQILHQEMAFLHKI